MLNDLALWLWRRPPLIMAAAVAVLVSLVLGGLAVTATDVPAGTTVLGIDIGGRSRADAAAALTAGLAGRTAEPVTVHLGEATAKLDPKSVGLAVDVDATVAAAAHGGPWRRVVEPVVTVDQARLTAALAGPAKKVARPMTAPKISYSGLTPVPTYPVAGQGVDPWGAADAMRAGWLRGDVTVPLVEVDPATSWAELDKLVADLAAPAVAAPVTVTTAKGPITVPPKAIAASLVLAGDAKGVVTPRVDEKKLRKALADELAEVEVQPRDATVGGSTILASTGGTLLDIAKLSRDLLGVLAKPAPRTVNGELKTVAAKTTTEHLSKQGIVERVSSFTTHFKGGQDRNKNIILVAKEVDGAIVEPGETFSLNGYTGPRGYAEGYVDAPVISDGKLVNAVGGGISQFTTTLFNAAYYAGLEDVFHKPHSYYISRYPSVIESTIIYPSLDMKFRNDSPYSVLIDTSWTDDSITVSLWSTERYDISTEWGPRTDVTQPVTKHLPDEEGCIATSGISGFSQDAWRIFKQDGQEIRREKFSWTYSAEPRFICG